MNRDIIFFTEGDRLAALRINRIAFERVAFCQHDHVAVPAKFNGGAQAGHPASDHEKVRLWRMIRSRHRNEGCCVSRYVESERMREEDNR